MPRFLFVASMPVGEEGEQMQRRLEDVLEKHRASQGTDARYKDIDVPVGPYNVATIENADINLVESWSFVENLFLYGQGKKIVEDAIDRFIRNGAGTLSLHQGYQSAYKEVARDDRGDALLYIQGDLAPTVKNMLASHPELKSVLEPKLAELTANRPNVALGMHISEGDGAAIREKVLVRLSKESLERRKGVCNAVTARFAQSDVLCFNAWQDSLKDMYKDAVVALQSGDGKEVKENVMLKRLEGAMGAVSNEDLLSKLDWFKGEFAISLSYVPQPNLKMNTFKDYLEVFQPVMILELDKENPVAAVNLKTLLGSLKKASGHEYLQTVEGGINIEYQRGAGPREDKAGPDQNGLLVHLAPNAAEPKNVPFFSAFANVDIDVEPGKQRKFLLLSDNLSALKRAVQQSQARFARSSLAEDKKFKETLKSFREGRTSISYLDMGRMVDVYSFELPRMSKAGTISRELADQLPSPGILREHVYPMAWATTALADPTGLMVECSSPLGNLPLIGVVGAVAWPAIVEQQQLAISEEMDTKFKKIWLGLNLYASDFERFPPAMSDLYPNYVKDLSTFESPFKRGSLKSPQDIDNIELSNLIYIPNKSLQDLGGDVIVYEKEPTFILKSGKLHHHVLRVGGNDGKKPWLTRSQIELALAGKVDFSVNVDNAESAPSAPRAPGAKGAPPKAPVKAAPKPAPRPAAKPPARR